MIPMKILQVSHSFLPCYDSGGVVRAVYEISKGLVTNGHEVTVYTTDGCTKRLKTKKNQPMPVEGINVYYFRNLSNKLRIKLKIATPYASFRVIRKDITKFDIIHIHEHRTILAVIVHRYAKKHGVPYVVQDHGSALPFFKTNFQKKVFDKIWGYDILKDASKLIALTETEAEQYKVMGCNATKIEFIPNSIDLSAYKKLPDKGNFRKKYNIQYNEKIILFLGRLHPVKGIDLLIKTFFKLSETFKSAKLVIAGPDDGSLSLILGLIDKYQIKNKVIITGPLYDEEKLEAYVDADVYVLTSIYDTFPTTVFEAMACKVPVIVTNNIGIADLICNVCFVVERNETEIKKAILQLITCKDMSDWFIQEGYGLVNTLDSKNIVKKFEKLYLKVLTESNDDVFR